MENQKGQVKDTKKKRTSSLVFPDTKPKVCDEKKTGVYIYEPKPLLWWERAPCLYAFRHPKIRSRLERLMGSNLVRLTDRRYMLKLQDRIFEDYQQAMDKRIAEREFLEREREKKLVLTGKVPFSNAPEEMKTHPVYIIQDFCNQVIADRRSKIKVPKVRIPQFLYMDDTPDPTSGLTIAEGHIFRKAEDQVCIPAATHLVRTDEEDIELGFMFTPEDMEYTIKFTPEQIEDMDRADDVVEMYGIADEIVGPLKTIKEQTFIDEYKF